MSRYSDAGAVLNGTGIRERDREAHNLPADGFDAAWQYGYARDDDSYLICGPVKHRPNVPVPGFRRKAHTIPRCHHYNDGGYFDDCEYCRFAASRREPVPVKRDHWYPMITGLAGKPMQPSDLGRAYDPDFNRDSEINSGASDPQTARQLLAA